MPIRALFAPSRLSRLAGIVLFVLPLLPGTRPGGAQARVRPFPDTRSRIRVFADQIPPGNTEAQNEFAATHYVGTQKMIRDDIRAIRAYNPDFLHLHYKLSVGTGDSTIFYVDGNQWVTDWEYVSQQDDWFVTDDNDVRIRHAYYGWYLMDVSGQISGAGDDGWKEYWAETCISQMRNNEADGVFADSYDVAVVNADYLDPPYWWFEGTNPATYWVPHLDIFGHFITDRIHAEPDGFVVLPNLGYQVTSWDPADYAFADGGMIEGFGQWGGDSPFALSDWKLQMNRILGLIGEDKILILQSYMNDYLDYDDRLFYLGCYLLVKGERTYINILANGPGLDMQYYPEYTLDLGPYVAEPPGDIDELLDAGTGVYRREYEKGLVLVNPTSQSLAVSLGAQHYRALPQGGGVVDAEGDYNGSLVYEPVTDLVLGACEGVVVLDELPVPEGQAADLVAFHRSGQTFLTWTEVATDEGETYRIYRHDQPISEENLPEATLIAEVSEGTAVYENELTHPNPVQHNFIIEDLGEELPDGTGLLVWTPHEIGPFYYAVTVVENGLENTTLGSENSLVEPVAETDEAPSPVLVWQAASGRGWVFTQFMDYAAWNPSFDGYAYNYGVGVPSNYDGATPFALTIYCDGWGTRYDAMEGSPYDYATIFVSIDDPRQTWYYGNAAAHDYGEGSVPSVGPIANFTEWRILRCVDDIVRDARFLVDENRIYTYGSSMGGSGALALGMRYPDVFAAAYAGAAMTDYETAGDFGGLDWEGDLVPKWGEIADNFGIVNLGPHAEPLQDHDGTGVWDWMDHQENMLSRIADEMAFIATAHGDADQIIEWESQGAPWYPIMDLSARRGFSGYVVAGGDHHWYGFVGCGNNFPFESYVFRKDRSFPGLTDGSLNTAYSHNQAIEWSCPWLDFAGDIVDTPDHYEIALRVVGSAGLPDSGTVDVTPRRLQEFEVVPGQAYRWRNETLPGEFVAEGTVVADEDGLLLIEDFLVTKAGNRLILDPESSGAGPASVRPSRSHLGQPRPNPFRTNLSLRFALAEAGEVRIEVLDARGRRVRVLAAGHHPAGYHELAWDGADERGRRLPAGIYFVRMVAAGVESARTVIKIR